ncbi:MAG: redoxin domain-containing protein [Pirellulales bacterium]
MTLLTLIACGAIIGTVAAAEPAKLSGQIVARVLTAEGKPAAGAEVEIFSFDREWRKWQPVGDAKRADDRGVLSLAPIRVEAYLLVARAPDGGLGLREVTLLDEAPTQNTDLALAKPEVATVRVRDKNGKPVAGAWIHRLTYTGANGEASMNTYAFDALKFARDTSDAEGVLKLPALPAGGRVDCKLMHADYAPTSVKGLLIAEGNSIDAVLEPGVRVTLRIPPSDAAAASKWMLQIFHEPYQHSSTINEYHFQFDAEGAARLTVAEGAYTMLKISHPEFLVAPTYSETIGKDAKQIVLAAGRDTFDFEVTKKVRVRGRVVDPSTGKAVPDAYLGGDIPSPGVAGPLAEFVEPWTHADWGDVDAEGRFEMKLAAGKARLSPGATGYTGPQDYYEIDVAADGSTVVPDMTLSPMPKVRGSVVDSAGRPVAGAVVRFAGAHLMHLNPVATDAQGRFELAPPWMPADYVTRERLPLQAIVAYHPHQLLSARTEVRLDERQKLDAVELNLQPQDPAGLVDELDKEFQTRWRTMRAKSAPDKNAPKSIIGQMAPELDGIAWLNTDSPSKTLADFRGKYVLLDFWATWCGPCHRDFPCVSLISDSYKDHGVVVIGVHDNSMPLDAIRADVEKEKLAFPIVVDHPDGRIYREYRAYGLSGYPSYVLIGPDGKVVHWDESQEGPSLRLFMTEIVRQRVLEPTGSSR